MPVVRIEGVEALLVSLSVIMLSAFTVFAKTSALAVGDAYSLGILATFFTQLGTNCNRLFTTMSLYEVPRTSY